jgi:hypothetical protein
MEQGKNIMNQLSLEGKGMYSYFMLKMGLGVKGGPKTGCL